METDDGTIVTLSRETPEEELKKISARSAEALMKCAPKECMVIVDIGNMDVISCFCS